MSQEGNQVQRFLGGAGCVVVVLGEAFNKPSEELGTEISANNLIDR